MNTKKSGTRKFLEKLTSGPLTIGRLLSSARKCEEETLAQFAKRIGVTVSHLSDIENGRKTVSPERAARFARALGLSEKQFIRVALQDELNRQGLKRFQVSIEEAA